jgi:hypothetical protein
VSGLSLQRLRSILGALDSPALGFAVVLVPLGLVPAALIGLRIALAIGYGGGVEVFDRHYENRVAEGVSQAESRDDGFARLVDQWRPRPLWQREILYTDAAPEDVCSAEYSKIEDGRMLFAIACATIEQYAAEERSPPVRRDLADAARDRALWLTARALRLSAAWLSELPVIVVHQQQQLAPGDVVVYISALELVGRKHELETVLAELSDRVTVVENTAAGRQLPISFR